MVFDECCAGGDVLRAAGRRSGDVEEREVVELDSGNYLKGLLQVNKRHTGCFLLVHQSYLCVFRPFLFVSFQS